MLTELETRFDISCDRCRSEPRTKQYLGCGEPPAKESTYDTETWAYDETDGELKSPARRHREGLAPFPQLGMGRITDDWPWCPRWFFAFDAIKLDGDDYAAAISNAVGWGDAVADAYPPPWTPAFQRGIELYRALASEAEREAVERVRSRRRG